MNRFATGLAGLALCLWPVFTFAGTAPISKISLSNLTKQQYLNMSSLGLDIVEASGDSFQILVDPADLQQLQHLGIRYTVDQPDVAAFYAARSAAAFGGFKTYDEIVLYLDSLAAAHPDICTSKFSIGKTGEGREMWVVKVSDNPGVDEDEPEVFYNSLIHAREPAGGAALLNVLAYLVTNYATDPSVRDLVDNRELFFLPVTNPDGYVYNEEMNPDGGGMWRKNRRQTSVTTVGIDLNRNFGYKWGYDEDGSSGAMSSEVYRGNAPFSEVETQHMRDFVASRHFTICHNIHTYSNLFMWPWGYDRSYCDQDDFFNVLGDSVTAFNGYTPEVGWTLYPTNGAADDWMWGDTVTKPRFISVTTEIGTSSDGFWPTPARAVQLVAENLQPNLYLAKIADNPYRLGPPQKPTPGLLDSVGQDYVVHWHCDDTINPPVSYALYELAGKETVTDVAESNAGYWTTQRMLLSNVRKHTGTTSWHSQNTNRANHWLISNTPYTVKPNDSLRFWIWYNLEANWDYFYAQVSTDGGYDYVNLANNLTTNSNPNNMNAGNGITGSSGAWVRAAFDLAPYVGKQVIFRLTQFTDSYTLNEGVYIDDIENVDVYPTQTLVSAAITDTLYAFSSKTPGQYWYRIAATDAEGQTSRLSSITGTSVYQDYIVGDLNGDRVIDLIDLSSLIGFLIQGQPVPDPMAVGNVNCVGIVDLSDLSRLISYLLGMSPKPACP